MAAAAGIGGSWYYYGKSWEENLAVEGYCNLGNMLPSAWQDILTRCAARRWFFFFFFFFKSCCSARIVWWMGYALHRTVYCYQKGRRRRWEVSHVHLFKKKKRRRRRRASPWYSHPITKQTSFFLTWTENYDEKYEFAIISPFVRLEK